MASNSQYKTYGNSIANIGLTEEDLNEPQKFNAGDGEQPLPKKDSGANNPFKSIKFASSSLIAPGNTQNAQ